MGQRTHPGKIEIPPELTLKALSGGVTVQDLERIAIQSQQGKQATGFFSNSDFLHLDGYEQLLRIRFEPIIQGLKKDFGGRDLIVADIECTNGTAAADLNRIPGVHAFGTGSEFWFREESGLPRERYIVSGKNELARIPNDSFHFLVSRGSIDDDYREDYDVNRLIHTFRRVLKPGGVGVFIFEFWDKHLKQLGRLGLDDELRLVSRETGHSANIGQFIEENYRPGMPDYHLQPRFELRKQG